MRLTPINESKLMEDFKKLGSSPITGRTSTNSGELAEQSERILANLVSRPVSAEPTFTYAEDAKKIGIHVCNLKHPVDHLSRTLVFVCRESGLQIPPLQIQVVNARPVCLDLRPLPISNASLCQERRAIRHGEIGKQKRISNPISAAISRYPIKGRRNRTLKTCLER